MTTKDLKTTLHTFMERVWNSGDFDQLETYVAEQYTITHDPGDPWEGQVLDLATFQERVLYSRNAFPDLRFDIQEMIAEDDKVVTSWVMSGTHQGDLPQLPASVVQFSITGLTIYSFTEGKVNGHWQAYDRLGFLAQIGYLG